MLKSAIIHFSEWNIRFQMSLTQIFIESVDTRLHILRWRQLDSRLLTELLSPKQNYVFFPFMMLHDFRPLVTGNLLLTALTI